MSGARFGRCLVTGSSRGIGLGICTVLAETDEVVAACRRPSGGLRTLGVTLVEDVDLGDDSATALLGEALGDIPLDLVVCNAGINESFDSDVDGLDPSVLAREYAVNALGAVRTMLAALPRLRSPGGRVALITTGSGATGRNTLDPGNYGYRMSKAALNTYGFLLARDLLPRGLAVVTLSPGLVDTDMVRSVGGAGRSRHDRSKAMDPVVAARHLVDRMAELTTGTTGRWIDLHGAEMP